MKHESRIMVLAAVVLLIIHNLLFVIPAFAQAESIGHAQIDPSSPFYFLKSIREIIELKVAPNSRVKALREIEISTRRIREVKSLVKTSNEYLIEPTLARYLVLLSGILTVGNLSDEVVGVQLIDSLYHHSKSLQEVYPYVSNPRARMSIRSTMNGISEKEQELIEKLNKLFKPHLVEKVADLKVVPCNFLLKESSSSALNEVEKVVLSMRAGKCFGGLSKD